MVDNNKNDDFCSFCGRSKNNVDKMIAGADKSLICNYCVNLCVSILNKNGLSSSNKRLNLDFQNKLKPSSIYDILDSYIIGQDKAKKILSVGVYNHYKNVNYLDDEVEIDKSNILLIGPTGCGKTLFAKTLSRLLKVPFVICDATTLTQSGYVGDDVETILARLLQASDYDVDAAQRGIICIDEVDKISFSKSDNTSTTRDVSGEGVQQALLKIMEGTISFVPPQGGRKHPQQENIQIDTTNILFIFCGAFIGLEDIIKLRTKGSSFGFGCDVGSDKSDDSLLHKVHQEDLIKYGLIPEFVGRFSVIATLDDLSESDLVRVMVEPKNSVVSQYKKLLEIDNLDIEFSDNSLIEIAKFAIKQKVGARGIRSVIENVLMDIMYNSPYKEGDKMIVDSDLVKKNILKYE